MTYVSKKKKHLCDTF